jgi:hypothetical protein
MNRGVTLFVGAVAVSIAAVHADVAIPVDIATRVRGASRAVVATVAQVESRWVTTAAGDRLIVTRTVARIDEALKGPHTGSLVVEIEGGTVGEESMRVSDMDVLPVGRRAVLLVEPNPDGTWRPHRRGLGVLPLDASDRVQGTGLSLDDVRRAARAAGGGAR